LVCEKGISEIEAISNPSVPQSSKTILPQKLQAIPKKTRM
jgi:hypothetical protein